MGKRTEENNRVKAQITEAYFDLLRQKGFDNITVTEITQRAHVSRMAYYRNFDTRLDIIRFYLHDYIWSNMNIPSDSDVDFWSLEYGIAFFSAMKAHRDTVLLLDDCGYASVILNEFNQRNEYLAGDMPARSIEKYNFYYASGASFNGMIQWLRDGCRESPEEMAQSMMKFMDISSISPERN